MKIGRRGFLGLLGAALPALALRPLDPPVVEAINYQSLVIGQWADYSPLDPQAVLVTYYSKAFQRDLLANIPKCDFSQLKALPKASIEFRNFALTPGERA